MIWKGIPLGFENRMPITYDGKAPTLVIGPQGSNKSVGIVVNALLDDVRGQHSFIVIDPKGEVAAITSRFRRQVCGAVGEDNQPVRRTCRSTSRSQIRQMEPAR